jgi:hypothetical protein
MKLLDPQFLKLSKQTKNAMFTAVGITVGAVNPHNSDVIA